MHAWGKGCLECFGLWALLGVTRGLAQGSIAEPRAGSRVSWAVWVQAAGVSGPVGILQMTSRHAHSVLKKGGVCDTASRGLRGLFGVSLKGSPRVHFAEPWAVLGVSGPVVGRAPVVLGPFEVWGGGKAPQDTPTSWPEARWRTPLPFRCPSWPAFGGMSMHEQRAKNLQPMIHCSLCSSSTVFGRMREEGGTGRREEAEGERGAGFRLPFQHL